MSTGSAQDIIEQLDTKIREARGTIKDLRQLQQQIKQLLGRDVKKEVEDRLHKELTELGDATREAMDDAIDRVHQTFSNLEDIYMGREKRDTEDLEDMTIRYMIREEVERYIEQKMTFKEPQVIKDGESLQRVVLPKYKKQ